MNTKKNLILGSLALLLAVVVFGSTHTTHAQATGPNVHGYAWSSTIGWISLEGVNEDTASGNFSGYGWSSNVGWVSFNAGDVSSCGPAANLSGSSITGWAKVISGPTTAGADGCISMHGASPAYGVSYNPATGALGGFAWGSTNVGWVDFEYAKITLITPTTMSTVDLKEAASGIPATDGPITLADSIGGPLTLSWTSTDVTACSADTAYTTGSGWTGTKAVPSGTAIATVPANTGSTTLAYTYGIKCTGTDGGSVSDSVTVFVPPSAGVTVVVTGSASALDLKINLGSAASDGPITMPTGGLAALTWTSVGMDPTTCRATSSSTSILDWGGAITAVGANSSSPVAIIVPSNPTISPKTFVYTITCNELGTGTLFTDSVTVKVPAYTAVGYDLHLSISGTATSFLELPSTGGTPSLTWISHNVSGCVASSVANDPAWTVPVSKPANSTSPVGLSFAGVPAYFVYTITCNPVDGSPHISSSVEVYVPPTGTGGTGGTSGSGDHYLPWIEI